MRVTRVIAGLLGTVVVALALSACSGSDSSSSAPAGHHRTIQWVQTLHCEDGQIVERRVGSNLYRCVTRSAALPVSRAPDVQQGDRCPTFGATTYNQQGFVFDCEPSGPDRELRWILP